MKAAYHIDWRYVYDILVPDLGSSVVRRILLTLGVLLTLVILRFFAKLVFESRIQSHRGRYYGSRIFTYLVLLIGAWFLCRVWLTGMSSVETFLGLISAGVAVAMKDPLVNIAGFFAILIRHPFRIGQRIQVGEIAGDVVDIRFLNFTLLEVGKRAQGEQSTGRLVMMPNGVIFTTAIVNYQGGFDYIWNEISVPLPSGVAWQAMKDALQEIVSRHAETDEAEIRRQLDSLSTENMVRIHNIRPVVYVGFDSLRVVVTARYLCRIHLRRVTESQIWEELLQRFPELTRLADSLNNA